MSVPQQYLVKRRREIRGEVCAEAGDSVYRCIRHDYGCSDDDTVMTGVKHVSVTKDPTGEYPFFTIPLADLGFVP